MTRLRRSLFGFFGQKPKNQKGNAAAWSQDLTKIPPFWNGFLAKNPTFKNPKRHQRRGFWPKRGQKRANFDPFWPLFSQKTLYFSNFEKKKTPKLKRRNLWPQSDPPHFGQKWAKTGVFDQKPHFFTRKSGVGSGYPDPRPFFNLIKLKRGRETGYPATTPRFFKKAGFFGQKLLNEAKLGPAKRGLGFLALKLSNVAKCGYIREF